MRDSRPYQGRPEYGSRSGHSPGMERNYRDRYYSRAIAVCLIIDILGGIIPLIGNSITIGVIGISIAVGVTMADPHHMINLTIFQPRITGERLDRPSGDPIMTILIIGETPYILNLM